jgi:hypothetical protein
MLWSLATCSSNPLWLASWKTCLHRPRRARPQGKGAPKLQLQKLKLVLLDSRGTLVVLSKYPSTAHFPRCHPSRPCRTTTRTSTAMRCPPQKLETCPSSTGKWCRDVSILRDVSPARFVLHSPGDSTDEAAAFQIIRNSGPHICVGVTVPRQRQ